MNEQVMMTHKLVGIFEQVLTKCVFYSHLNDKMIIIFARREPFAMQIISGKIARVYIFFSSTSLFFFVFSWLVVRFLRRPLPKLIYTTSSVCCSSKKLFVLGWAVFCSQRFKTALVYYFSCWPCPFSTSPGPFPITRYDCAAGFSTQRHFSLKIEEA